MDALHKPVHLPGNFCADNKLPDWFRDVPDNKRYCRDLTLTQKAGTPHTYEYNNQNFFPIDDVASNENQYTASDGKIHNFHFCMEMHATFKYEGGEVFDFLGDDDVWVYVNNQLALDLGGLHVALAGTVNLDAQKDKLKIAVGSYYNFDFFFCERQTEASHMKVTTSIDIVPPPAPGLHIADDNLNVIQPGDTLPMELGASRIFNAVKIGAEFLTIDCSNVVSQTKTPESGNWTFNNGSLPAGSQVSLSAAGLGSGVFKLLLEKGGLRDSIYIKVAELPKVAKPIADPPGGDFAESVLVTLTVATPGVTLHYTTDGTVPGPSSPVCGGPITLTATTTPKAIAIKAGHTNSDVMSHVFSEVLAKAVKGYYQDRDGDGRIETAVILFDEKFSVPPKGFPWRIAWVPW